MCKIARLTLFLRRTAKKPSMPETRPTHSEPPKRPAPRASHAPGVRSAQRTFSLIMKLTAGTCVVLAIIIVLIQRQYKEFQLEQKILDSMKLAQLCKGSIEAAARFGLSKEQPSFSNVGGHWTADFDCGETSMTLRKFNPNMTSRLNTDGSGTIAVEIFDLTDEGSIDEVLLVPFRDKDFQHRMQSLDFVRPHHFPIVAWKCGPVHYGGKDILMQYLPEDCRENDIEQFRY